MLSQTASVWDQVDTQGSDHLALVEQNIRKFTTDIPGRTHNNVHRIFLLIIDLEKMIRSKKYN